LTIHFYVISSFGYQFACHAFDLSLRLYGDAMPGQGFKRKLTAIFSADVEGYSRLMGEDEEATIRTLTTYREILTSHIQQQNGRVIDSPGDNLLAEFASVVDAVQCAVAVQHAISVRNGELPNDRKMMFRIGINLGDVIQEADRIYGDGVNIAARLESLCVGGGICISGTAHEHVENKLDLEFVDWGEHSVKNIKKPLRVYRVNSPGVHLESVPGPRPSLPPKPSIAVLPFDNMSGDPDQEFFSDGISEQIISGICRIRDLFVIARNSSFAYKGKVIKVQQVGSELGVRYVLEGSVQRSNQRVRITAQLIDAQTDHHLWADNYDRELEDIFAIQDEITIKLIDALSLNLIEGEQWRQWEGRTSNIKAYLAALQGIQYSYRLTREDNFQACRFLEKAIALDPGYPVPQAFLGQCHLADIFFDWSTSPRESFQKAEEAVQKALVLAGDSDFAHSLMSPIHLMRREHDLGIKAARHAISLNPNGANAYTWLAFALIFSGRPAEAIAIMHKAIRLNPFPPPYYYLFLGLANRVAGNYEEAMKVYRMAVDGCPNAILVLLGMTACYVNLGRLKEAQQTAAEIMKTYPDFSLEWYAATMPFRHKSDLDPFIESLRKAGLHD
jgi:adenylate cyclase